MTQIIAKSHIAIALQSIDAFVNDGRINAAELQKMLDTALADNQIDAEESRVLSKVLLHAKQAGLDAETTALVASIKARHGIG
jgi:hypothetical protein